MKLDGVELEDVGDVIATRELELKPSGRVVATIGKPQKFPGSDGQYFYCPYQTAGSAETKFAMPAGSMQCKRSSWS